MLLLLLLITSVFICIFNHVTNWCRMRRGRRERCKKRRASPRGIRSLSSKGGFVSFSFAEKMGDPEVIHSSDCHFPPREDWLLALLYGISFTCCLQVAFIVLVRNILLVIRWNTLYSADSLVGNTIQLIIINVGIRNPLLRQIFRWSRLIILLEKCYSYTL